MTPSEHASAIRGSKWGFFCGGLVCVCFFCALLIQMFAPGVTPFIGWIEAGVAAFGLWMLWASISNLRRLGVKLNE